MSVTTNTGKKSVGLGARIIAHLAKHGPDTVEGIAAALKAPRRDVSARCWWLAVKEGRLASKGEGRERLYSLPAKPRARKGGSK